MIVLFEGGDGLAVDRENASSTPPLRGGALRAASILDHAAKLLVRERPLSERIRIAARDAAVASVEEILRALGRKPCPLLYVFGDPLQAVVVRGGSIEIFSDDALDGLIGDASAVRARRSGTDLDAFCARLLEEALRLSAVTMR